MNILLIGHRGYLGSGLLSYFRDRHTVIGWDQEEDLFSLDAAVLARNDIQIVINLAVAADRASSGFTIDTPSDVVNVGGARHLARILKGSEIMWFQFSTREALGPVYRPEDVFETAAGDRPKFLVDESFPYAPQNSYGKSKIIAEFVSESHPFSNVIRLTTGYTEQDHPASNWFVKVIRTALKENRVGLTRGGRQFRDPLHTDDLGRLMEMIYERGVVGERFHAGGGEGNLISLREFVEIAVPGVAVEDAPGGDYGFAFDNSKATSLTGWEPMMDLRERLPVIVRNLAGGLARQESRGI